MRAIFFKYSVNNYQVGSFVTFNEKGNHPYGFEGIATIQTIRECGFGAGLSYIVVINNETRPIPYWDEDLKLAFTRRNKEAKHLLKR